ncbi:DUF1294 domain-containing protein [Methanolobus sp. ZRKC3]|uniref:DUF1294 domain-containing protein n=1 Tax=Methanolobus sp. ZRKC3 TaxID=3125786 RepID=UPI0032560062
MDILLVFVAYLLAVNVIAFSVMGIDKKKAINKKYRIPEKTLFAWAIAGGSVGSIAGMQFFRHKTRHMSFRVGMPLYLWYRHTF